MAEETALGESTENFVNILELRTLDIINGVFKTAAYIILE